MKPHKQTTSAVSSIAGKYARMNNADMAALAWGFWATPKGPHELAHADAEQFFRDIRKLAASCLAQDQVKGQGK